MSTHRTVLVISDSNENDRNYEYQLQQDRNVAYRILKEQYQPPILTLSQLQQIDAILLELHFPASSSINLLRQLKEQMGDRCPPIIVIDDGDTKTAVQAFKNGAADYLVRDQITADDLRLSMRSAIENAELRRELQRSQQQFQTSVENMLDCFGIFSAIRDESGQILDFRIDYLNAAACENNQMPKEMQIGRGLCEVLSGHRESGLFDEYCNVVETGEPLIKDSLIYDDTYSDRRLVRAFDIRATKLNDGFVASWRNVTDRKRLEVELKQTVIDLQQQQKRLKRLIDTAPIGIGIATADGHVTVINDTMLRLHGYTREEFQQHGMNWCDFAPPELSAQTEQTIEYLRQHGVLPPAEKELIRRDGTRLPIWISATQWADGTDEHVAFAVDLSQQKQAEAAIQQLNRELTDRISELQTLLDILPVGVAITTDPACTEMQSNAYIREMLGAHPGENISKSAPTANQIAYRPLQNGQEISAENLPMQIAARLGVEVRDVEFDIRLPDGRVRQLLCYATPLRDDQNQIRGAIGAFLDITERNQSAAALKFSQQRYQELAEAMPQMVWTADPNGTVNYWNQRWYEFTGQPEAAGLGLGWLNAVHSEDYEATRTTFLNAVERHEAFQAEYRLRDQEGHYRWVIGAGNPWTDPEGQFKGHIGSIADIHDRKLAEEALRQSEDRLRIAIASAQLGTWDWNLITRELTWDAGCKTMFGLPPEAESSIEIFFEALHPDDRDRVEQVMEWSTNPASGGDYDVEYRTIGIHNHIERWIKAKGQAYFDAIGTPLRMIGTVLDITEQKRAEAALQERRDHIELLYETTRDLLSSTQPLTLIETLFNKLKDLVGLDVYLNYILDESQQKLQLAYYGGISQDIAQQVEWLNVGQTICGTVAQQHRQIVRKDVQRSDDPQLKLARSLGTITYACQPLIVQGKLLGTLSFGSFSRTEFTTSEQALFQAICDQIAIALERSELLNSLQQQTEELMRVNRIKDEFLAILSHELRSPLNPILGWTKLLQAGKVNDTQMPQALATIERNANLQTQLIDDLLDIAKILRGKLTLNVSPVNLSFVIEAAIETVRTAATAKTISLQSVLPNVGQVAGDAARLQQVVWNLLSNAIKFTPSGGQVAIQLEQVGNQAKLTISDTGKGISPEFLPYIFESFQQEDASITRKYGGLGLGLAIVRQLVEAHGGTVTADSLGEGLGATFTVLLPLLNAEPVINPSIARPQHKLDLTGIRVLAVDDEPDARDLLAVLLTQYGAEVLVVTSAAEVLSNLESFQPHILVSDIGMPEVNGYTLIQQMRSLPVDQGGQIPAIALTAYAREDDHQRAMTSGYQQHITKPLDPEHLVQAIVTLVH